VLHTRLHFHTMELWKQILEYEDELMSLLHLLHEKSFSKRGFSWTGKLLSSLLLTLVHSYPLENRFANPKEWDSEGNLACCKVSGITYHAFKQNFLAITTVTGENCLHHMKSR
jgi:hypothetical protein